MEKSRNIKMSASKGAISIEMPSCGRAYVPKINLRRPGNIIFGLFLVFLILLFAGLAFADDHKHHYGNVEVVINVASLTSSDLASLRRNQVVVNAPEPLRRDMTMTVRTDDDVSNRMNSLFNLNESTNAERKQKVNREEPNAIMRDFRQPLPLDQARVLLNSVPFKWPQNDSVTHLLNDWQDKYTVMTEEQNLNMINLLLSHFKTDRRTRQSTHPWLVSFEVIRELGPKRVKRDEASVCADMKASALKLNEERKRDFIMGWAMLNPDYLCLFARKCYNGTYPNPAGCQSSPDVVEEESIDYHISDTVYDGHQDPYPSVDLTNICEIGTMRVRTCSSTMERIERLTFYKGLGQSKYWIGDSSVNVSPHFISLSDFSCMGEASKSCDGDEIFKKTFSSAGADQSCFCKAETNRTITSLTLGATTYRVDLVFYDFVRILYSKKPESELLCAGCEISCNKGEIRVDYTQEVEMIEMCSGRFCLDLRPSKVFTVPLSLASLDHTFKYYIRFEDDKEMTGSIQCKVEDLCPLIDCHLCYEKLKNPHCYNFVDKANFIIMLAVWFLILAILVKAMKICWFVVMAGKNLVKIFFKIGFWVSKGVCGFMGKQLTRVNVITTKAEEQWDGSIRTVEHKTSKIVLKPKATYIKSIVLLAILLPLCSPCSDTRVLTSKQMSCLMAGSNMKCRTKETISISVAPVGQSSCFILKALDGRILGSMSVETLSLDLLCNENILYYTFPARSSFDQKCYCTASASGWGSDGSCDGYNKNTKCGKPLTCKPALQTSGCKTAQGGWEQSCFSYGSQYCYYRMTLENKSGKVFKVSHCTSFYWEAKVRMTIQTLNNTSTVKASLNSGSKMNFKGGNLQLISASVPPMPILSSCFLRSGDVTYVTDCIKGGGIVAGRVGDIQCKSQTSGLKPSNEECSFASGLWKVEAQGGRLSLTTSLFDYSQPMKRLPISSGGFMVKEESGIIKASLNHISMMSLRLTLDDMSVQPYSVETKCFIKVLSVKGCVSCLTGAVLKLKIKSTPSSTKAIIECPSLKAQIPFLVKPTEEIISLQAHFENGKLKEKCMVTCPGNTVDVPMEADLVSDVSISRTVEDHLSDYSEVMGSWLRDIFGQFDGYLTIAIVGVVILGSILVLKLLLDRPSYHSRYKSF